METWITSENKYDGKIFSVRAGDVRLDDGRVAQREVIKHSGGVAIVPVEGDSVILIKQFRIAVGREIIELPAGMLEEMESPESCAHRELEEEIGYRAGEMIPTVSFFSSVGFLNEKIHIFLAFQLKETKAKPEWDERIEKVKIPIKDIETKLWRNEFEDSKTIVGLHKLLAYQKGRNL